MKYPQRRLVMVLIIVFTLFASCKNNRVIKPVTTTEKQYKRWTVSQPVFEKGPKGSFDELAVKDPSIVFFNKKYHMFYTSKTSYETRDKMKYLDKNGSGMGYVEAETIEKLNEARRYNLSEITESVIVAPEVFYFEPQKLWYLIAQTAVDGKLGLQPVFMTNNDIENVKGWSKPEILKTNKTNDGFWIDFWIICDDKKAHLFYTDHEGSLFRFECPVKEFPQGFAIAKDETVLTERGENKTGRWRLHEASHIYYVKKYNQYLALLEAVYPHPVRKNYWESRNRFLFGMVADKLEGPWRRIETGPNDFLGDPANLYDEAGKKSVYDQVSHPELILAGYNQKLEINDFKLQLLFQAFDADSYEFSEIWSAIKWVDNDTILFTAYSNERRGDFSLFSVSVR